MNGCTIQFANILVFCPVGNHLWEPWQDQIKINIPRIPKIPSTHFWPQTRKRCFDLGAEILVYLSLAFIIDWGFAPWNQAKKNFPSLDRKCWKANNELWKMFVIFAHGRRYCLGTLTSMEMVFYLQTEINGSKFILGLAILPMKLPGKPFSSIAHRGH